MALEAIRARHDLSDELRITARGRQHVVGLRGVEAHAGLGQDMLAGFQGGESDGTVEIGPGADHKRVDGRVGDEVLPMLIGARDRELAGSRKGGGRPAVADRGELHCWDGV